MSDKRWQGQVVDPFASGQGSDVEPDGYKPWRSNTQGVRDLMLFPATGSGEEILFIPYMQAITLKLYEDETQLCLVCHTSGHMIFIIGRELGDLARQISGKRVQSVHVFNKATDGSPPAAIVTGLRVEDMQSS